jgi:putative exosortase-associated protein (TIGR04073 family)
MKGMKRNFIVAFVLMYCVSSSAFASGPVMKLGRGVTNVLTSPLEFFVQYDTLTTNHNAMVAFVGGTIYGALFTAGRIIVGAFEILTFPFPIPADYAPVMDPPTALDAMDQVK